MNAPRMSDDDYYKLLGVGRGAAEGDIRRAFRALARQLHPDVNHGADAAARFAAVVRAYDTLIDPQRRRTYDLGHNPSQSGPQRPTTPPGGGPFWPTREQGVPAHDQTTSAATGGGGLHGTRGGSRFDAPFTRDRPLYYEGAGDAIPRSPLRGLDVHHTVYLTLREIARGVTRDVQAPRREVCILCSGTGAAADGISRPCPTCHGSGRSRSGVEACGTCGGSGSVVDVPCQGCGGSGRRQGLFDLPAVYFPPGIPSRGFTKRFKGEGDPGPRGGPRGELLVHVVGVDQPHLRRAAPEGADILSEVYISPGQAAHGGHIQAPTVHGPVTLRLPRAVASGTTFTLKGKGLRLPGRYRRGDQHTTVIVGDQPTA